MYEKSEYAQTKRVLEILHLLCAADSVNRLSLNEIFNKIREKAVEKGLTERTIYRDLKFLREDMEYVIKQDGARGYFISYKDKASFPISKKLLEKMIKVMKK